MRHEFRARALMYHFRCAPSAEHLVAYCQEHEAPAGTDAWACAAMAIPPCLVTPPFLGALVGREAAVAFVLREDIAPSQRDALLLLVLDRVGRPRTDSGWERALPVRRAGAAGLIPPESPVVRTLIDGLSILPPDPRYDPSRFTPMAARTRVLFGIPTLTEAQLLGLLKWSDARVWVLQHPSATPTVWQAILAGPVSANVAQALLEHPESHEDPCVMAALAAQPTGPVRQALLALLRDPEAARAALAGTAPLLRAHLFPESAQIVAEVAARNTPGGAVVRAALAQSDFEILLTHPDGRVRLAALTAIGLMDATTTSTSIALAGTVAAGPPPSIPAGRHEARGRRRTS